MLVVLFPPKSSLDSLSHSLAYLKDWQHVATDTFKQQILGSILQGVPKNAQRRVILLMEFSNSG